MRRLVAALAVTAGYWLNPVQAAVVNFDDTVGQSLVFTEFDPGQSFSDQGLTFTYNGGAAGGAYMFVYDGTAPGSNGSNNLLVGASATDSVTITQTGGGLFSLSRLTLGVSFTDPAVSTGTVTINGTPLAITSTATSYAVNLAGVTSVTIAGLSGGGYFTADDIAFAVPEPASFALLGIGLAGFGLLRARRAGAPPAAGC